MRRALAVLLLSVLALHAAAGQARDLIERAEQNFATGDYQLAAVAYDDLLERFPRSEFTSLAQLRLGQIAYVRGDLEAAAELLQVAERRVGPGDVSRQVRLWLGVTLARLGRTAAASELLAAYVATEQSELARARLYLGLAERGAGRAQVAAEHFAFAADDPDLAQAERLYAEALLIDTLYELARYDAVLERFEAGDDQGVYRAQNLRRAADAAFATGRLDRARELYTQLTEFPEPRWAYAQLYELAGDDQAAVDRVVREAERALAADPAQLAEFWFALGRRAFDTGNVAVAELYLDRVWSLRDVRALDGAVPLLLAQTLRLQGRPGEALDVIDQSLTLELDQETLRRAEAARMAIELSELETAAQYLASIAGATEPPIIYLQAYVDYARGMVGAARDRLLGAEAARIADPRLARLLARSHLDLGEPVLAVRAYRQYLTRVPNDRAATRELRRALFLAGQISALEQELAAADRNNISSEEATELAFLDAMVAFSRADYEQARRILNGVDAAAYEPMRSYHLAWSEYRLGNTARASQLLQTVRDQLPPAVRVDGEFLYAWTRFAQNDAPGAIDAALRGLAAEPTLNQEREIRRLLAAAYRADGQLDAAAGQYETLVALAADQAQAADALITLGTFWRESGRVDEALDAYARVADLELRPAAARALALSGQTLLEARRYSAALEAFRSYQDRYPDEADLDWALYGAGVAVAELGQPARALLWWEPFIEQVPESALLPDVLIRTAAVYAERDELRRAAELYDRFLATFPEHPSAPGIRRLQTEARLSLGGLSQREAELLAELEPGSAQLAPQAGSERWFELVLELGRIVVRERVGASAQRGRTIEYLIDATQFDGPEAADASLLLGEYYLGRNERNAAQERFAAAAATRGAQDEQRARALYELALIAREAGDQAALRRAGRRLVDDYPETIWAERVQLLLEDTP